MASEAHFSAADDRGPAGLATANPGLDPGVSHPRDFSRPSTPLASNRRIGGEASPDPMTSPGPKRLAQHQSVQDPTRGPAVSIDELTFEVHKFRAQKPMDS